MAGAGPAPRIPSPPARSEAARARTQSAPPSATAPRVQPSFDCSRARSRPERLICADTQLAQLDRELGRLHSRAREGAADPADFKRRSDAEWARREALCRERDCLLAWYAQRRAQLLDEIDEQRAQRTAGR